MPEPAAKSVYLINAASDPVIVRIDGRACFQNSPCLREFFVAMLAQGKTRFVLDFQLCASVDSTFLGVLAGTALELKKKFPDGSLVLVRVGARNLELIRNLGLHRMVTIDAGQIPAALADCRDALQCRAHTELENARHVLEAHENLVAADEANRAKFQDVLAFLRSRVEQK
jgi:anti-anti-sigma regulatory factor